MDDGGPTVSYSLLLILLLIEVFFYGFGSALQNLNSKDIEDRAENEKDKKSRLLDRMILKPERYVNTVQLVSTLINLMIGYFFLTGTAAHVRGFMLRQLQINESSGFLLHMYFIPVLGMVIATTILMYLLLTFAVLIPKKLGAKYAVSWSYALVLPAYYTAKILAPLTGLVSVTAKGILRIFHIHADEDNSDVTEEEIISMVNEGHEQGVLLATEAEMITNIFEFGDKEAKDIMSHRNNIIALDNTMRLSEAIEYMLTESKSRFPVYEENIDHIVGILHFRDAMRFSRDPNLSNWMIKDIEGMIREPYFIPETKNIDDLFQYMQQNKVQMVIVVDEYGQTSGVLAMEDILEEIVGNIMDEYDEDEAYIEETENKDEYIIEGKTPLEELEERLDISFDEEEFETLNGFLIAKMDKIPDENEQFTIDVDGYNFKILSVSNKMIQSVLVTKLQEKKQNETKGEELCQDIQNLQISNIRKKETMQQKEKSLLLSEEKSQSL